MSTAANPALETLLRPIRFDTVRLAEQPVRTIWRLYRRRDRITAACRLHAAGVEAVLHGLCEWRPVDV